MDFEFDKQIDSHLRQMARGEIAVEISSSHLDADEISAFAENVLPRKARANAMEHLADCNRCRKILADVILLNSESESEIIHAKPAVDFAALPKLPWFHQFFAFSNLTYAMGALVVVFGGVIAFAVFQGLKQDSNSSVAGIEKPYDSKSANTANSAPVQSPTGSNTSSNTAASNSGIAASSANTAMNTPIGSATPTAGGSITGTGNPEPIKAGEDETLKTGISKTDAPVDKVIDEKAKTEESKPENRDADVMSKGGASRETSKDKKEANLPPDTPATQTNQQNVQNRVLMPDTGNGRAGGGITTETQDRAEKASPKVASKKVADADKERRDTESREVGGKTFRKAGGIWTDSAYTGGGTKNVKRNSDDYKKLDSNLRSIADSLGGTVIVVWSGKAYKIQLLKARSITADDSPPE